MSEERQPTGRGDKINSDPVFFTVFLQLLRNSIFGGVR